MVERLARLREPAVIVLLVALTLRLGLGVAGVVTLTQSGSLGGTASALTLGRLAYTATDSLAMVVLFALVASCVVWSRTRHARSLTTWALVVTGLGLLGSLASVIAWLSVVDTSAVVLGDGARILVGLVLAVLALVGLATLRSGQSPAATSEQRRLESSAAAAASEPPLAVTARREEVNEPTWQPDQAAGAAWLRAGDAAAGAAAAGWGTPGETGGWHPAIPPEQLGGQRPALPGAQPPEPGQRSALPGQDDRPGNRPPS